MTTGTRDAISVTLDGEAHLLMPSFKAVRAIETVAGKSMVAVIADLEACNLTMVAIVLHQALCANGFTAHSLDDVGELVLASLHDRETSLVRKAINFMMAYLPVLTAGAGADAAPPKKPAKATRSTG